MKWDELPGSFDWDRKLAYFLDPANQKDISKEDLQDTLAVLASMYCDEFCNLRFLECFVEEELGSDKLDEAIENSISTDSVADRSEAVLDLSSTEDSDSQCKDDDLEERDVPDVVNAFRDLEPVKTEHLHEHSVKQIELEREHSHELKNGIAYLYLEVDHHEHEREIERAEHLRQQRDPSSAKHIEEQFRFFVEGRNAFHVVIRKNARAYRNDHREH